MDPNDGDVKTIELKSSKTSLNDYYYRTIKFPSPLKDRFTIMERSMSFLENENIICSAYKTTNNAINAFSNVKKTRKVHMKIVIAGSLYEQIHDNVVEISYVNPTLLRYLYLSFLTNIIIHLDLCCY